MADQSSSQQVQSNNGSSVLQSILPNITQGQDTMLSTQNPVTNLTDSQASALQSVLDAQDKQDAKQAVTLHGSQTMRQLLDAHNAASQISNKGITNNNSTSPTRDSQSSPQASSPSILDPLIRAAQQQQTTLPAQTISNPSKSSNVQRGNFEFDKPQGLFEKFFGKPQVYQDNQGITHYKPGGSFFGSQGNENALQQAGSLQSLSGTEAVQPKDSIAYGLEAAKQAATNVPMNQAQQAEYNLSLQDKALTLANQQRDQFNTQTAPIITNLQKLDQLLPLEQAAVNGDRTAQSSIVAGAKELYGQAGNILGQGVVGKMATYIGGKYDSKSVQALVSNMKTVRQAMIKKLSAATKNASSKIGNISIGDRIISGRDLLNNPYASETLSKGDMENGFKFKGGDPSDKNNWEKS